MGTLEQFLFLLVPGVIIAGGMGAVLLHRCPAGGGAGHRRRRPAATAGRTRPARRAKATRRKQA